MPDWAWWLIVAILLLVGEIIIFTGFILGPLSLAAGASALTAAAGGGIELQLAVFAVGGIASLLVLRPLARKHLDQPAELRTNAAALIGERARVLKAMDFDNQGQVRLSNGVWTAEPAEGIDSIPEGALVTVVEIKGAIAVVAPEEGNG